MAKEIGLNIDFNFDFVFLVYWVLVAIDILTYQVVFSGSHLYILRWLVSLDTF